MRVHLRPFLAAAGNAPELLDVFVRTANGFRGSGEQLGSCWAAVEALAVDALLPFTQADAKALGRRMEDAGYPAVHHSSAYREAYRPAYRVVARALLTPARWATSA